MTTDNCTQSRFMDDVRDHAMEIIKDDGLYRHIRYSHPDSDAFYFDLITWPGHLCMTGDMGTYTFSRVSDMFTFFRDDRGKKDMSINPGYWGEKLLSISRSEGYQEFSKELFKENLQEDFAEMFEGYTEEETAEAWGQVTDEILNCMDDDHPATSISRVMEFRFDGFDEEFTDFWEHNFDRFTFHYRWCCYALVWGIGMYDKHKQR